MKCFAGAARLGSTGAEAGRMDGWMDEKLSNSILFNFLLKNGI
jgi:hypothetical protein